MPARKSILTKNSESNKFAPVDTAIKLYKAVLQACIKMPKRYTFFGLQETAKHAGDVMDFAKKANSVFINDFTSHDDYLRRIGYWKQARESLQALSTRINVFLELESDILAYERKMAEKKKKAEKKKDMDNEGNLETNSSSTNISGKDENSKDDDSKNNKIRGVTPQRLNFIEDLIIKEQSLLTNTISREIKTAKNNYHNWSEKDLRKLED